jgi:class 3 adenylate cyclase
MAESPNEGKVVPLPLLKGGSIEDVFTGFASQIGPEGPLGRRVEHATTVLVAGIRGWERVWERFGSDRAGGFLQQAVDRVLGAVEALGAADVAVGGDATQPIVTVAFSDADHALRGVVAAQAVRDAAEHAPHPSVEERFQACVGVNTGTVVDTHVNGAGIDFSASGTTRMFAVRLQEFAGPGQVFISESTYRSVPAPLDVFPIGDVRTSGDGETQQAFSLRGLTREIR